MKTLSSLLFFGFFLSSVVFAKPGTIEVECWTLIKEKKDVISLRLDSHGKIVFWEENQIAKADKTSVFSALAENTEEYGFESIKFLKGKNGYSIVQAVTTADQFTVGVSKNLTLGFYSYKDFGSGSGNSTTPLTCSKK